MQDLFPCQGLAGVFHEELDDGILHLGELDALAVLFQAAAAGVEDEGGLADDAVVADVAANAAVEGVDAGGELCGGEGLGDVVVGPGHKAGDLVHLLGAGGEHDDADLRVARPDAAADLEAVHIRQHDVQQGHTHVGVQAQLLQGLLPGAGLDGLIPGAVEVDDHKAADVRFILQD